MTWQVTGVLNKIVAQYCSSITVFVFLGQIFVGFGLSGRINGVKYKGLYRLGFQNVAVGRIDGVTALTGFY